MARRPRKRKSSDPRCDFMWEAIEKAQKAGGEISKAYKSIWLPRVYGDDREISDTDEA